MLLSWNRVKRELVSKPDHGPEVSRGIDNTRRFTGVWKVATKYRFKDISRKPKGKVLWRPQVLHSMTYPICQKVIPFETSRASYHCIVLMITKLKFVPLLCLHGILLCKKFTYKIMSKLCPVNSFSYQKFWLAFKFTRFNSFWSSCQSWQITYRKRFSLLSALRGWMHVSETMIKFHLSAQDFCCLSRIENGFINCFA